MFKYLVIPRNRLQFEIDDPNGAILHQTRDLLRLLKDRFREVVFARFKGKPTRPEYCHLDLVLIAPHKPPSALIGNLVDGYILKLINTDDPGIKVRLARHEYKLDLGGRKKREGGGELLLSQTFETRSKKLVAIMRMETIDPTWRRGTSARVTPDTRFGFFISTEETETYRGHRGMVQVEAGPREEREDL